MVAQTRGNLIFVGPFTLYTATVCFLLLLGLGSAAAAASPRLADTFDSWSQLGGVLAPLWRGMLEAAALTESPPLLVLDYGVSALNIGAAIFLVRERPSDRVARLLALGMAGTAAAFNFQTHGMFEVAALQVPRLAFLNALHFGLHAVSGAAYVHALLLFPDGRLVPRALRWVPSVLYGLVAVVIVGTLVRLVVLGQGGALLPDALSDPAGTLDWIVKAEVLFFVVLFGVLIPGMGIGAQLYRLRSTPTGRERQQSKLLLSALAASASVGLLYFAFGLVAALTQGLVLSAAAAEVLSQLTVRALPPVLVVIPLAMVIAMLRHGLFDLDAVAYRSLVYTPLTALIIVLFLVSVFALQLVLRPILGGPSELAVAAAALASGALLQPLRRRVRTYVDRLLVERTLLTLLFTDIVDSTGRAIELGDHRWRQLLEGYYRAVRGELTRFRGREVATAGDGFVATFEGPARAIRCAWAINATVQELGLAVRTAVHSGECEVRGSEISGISVHTAARIMTAAAPNEVLVSSTVRDLVAGSGIHFADRGTHQLKGIPGEWRLCAVAAV